jgi:uncharacterized membrane protein YidH (DUF202 family)
VNQPGLASERTELAWSRTMLSTAAAGALLLKLGIDHDRPVEVVAAFAMFVDGAIMWISQWRRRHSRAATVASSTVLIVTTTTICGIVLAGIGGLF